jgi:hypothetical protein
MISRPKTIEHIVVFDMEGEMVAGETREPFWYLYQKEYFLGNKKIGEHNYNSKTKKVGLNSKQMNVLRKRVDKMLNEPFCYVDDDNNEEWLNVEIRGGSSISYMGEHKNKFLEKVIDNNPRTR